jgi:hypothetical protein
MATRDWCVYGMEFWPFLVSKVGILSGSAPIPRNSALFC